MALIENHTIKSSEMYVLHNPKADGIQKSLLE